MSVRKVVATPAVSVANPTTPSFQILTVQQVAALLQVSPATIYELTRFRKSRTTTPIPHIRVGRYLRFFADAIGAWLHAQPQAVNSQKRGYVRTKKHAGKSRLKFRNYRSHK